MTSITYGSSLQKCGGARAPRLGRIEPPPHNRVKLPFFAVCATIAAAFLISGMSWVSAVTMSLVLAGSLIAIVTIVSGRHPWWLRSAMDRGEAERRTRSRK